MTYHQLAIGLPAAATSAILFIIATYIRPRQ